MDSLKNIIISKRSNSKSISKRFFTLHENSRIIKMNYVYRNKINVQVIWVGLTARDMIMKEFSWVMEMFYILIEVVITDVYTCQNSSNCIFKNMYFIVCK